MIVRVSRAYVRKGKEKQFEEFLANEAVPFMKKQKGLRDFSYSWSQQRPGVMNFVSWWETFEDVKRFGGPRWHESVVLPNEMEMVEKFDCEHYETLPRWGVATPLTSTSP